MMSEEKQDKITIPAIGGLVNHGDVVWMLGSDASIYRGLNLPLRRWKLVLVVQTSAQPSLLEMAKAAAAGEIIGIKQQEITIVYTNAGWWKRVK